MIVLAARKYIRCRQSHVGQLGAVGAAPDWGHDRLNPETSHYISGDIHNIHVWFDFFAHIEILVTDIENNFVRTVFRPQCISDALHLALTGFELLAVKIANEILKACLLYIAINQSEMIEGGRLIRSEQDTGLLVLVDDRYLQPHYARLLPAEWGNHVIIKEHP
ncbi:hypothetical protein D3C77_459770 [compost metagenome]